MRKVISGSVAVAHAVRLCKPKVVAAYPITPSTIIVEKISEFVANGELDAEFIPVESEHSACSACLGAVAAGVRAFTATASQGLKLMSEVLFNAAGMCLPFVIAVGNRSLSAPINIWCDHSDSFAERDSGFIQFYAKNAQEAFDTIIMAYKVAENKDVMLPAMVCLDGFILTHTYEPVDIAEEELVDSYLPPYNPPYKLDPENPVSMGTWASPAYYQDFKKAQQEAMEKARDVIVKANDEFGKIFGRKYGNGRIEVLNEDAKNAIITIGSVAESFEYVIEKHNLNFALIRIKTFRPFPEEDLINICANYEKIGVFEKMVSLGSTGAIYAELRSVLYELEAKPKILEFIGGLGGRDVNERNILDVIKKIDEKDRGIFWI